MKSESFAPNEQVQTQQSPGLFPVLEATVGGIIKHVVKSSKADNWKGIDLVLLCRPLLLFWGR